MDKTSDNSINSSKYSNFSTSYNSVWQGPEKSGITFSLLSRFLCCRERFRLLVCEGLKPKDTFNHRIEYGSMWHICEEAYANPVVIEDAKDFKNSFWRVHLKDYCQNLSRKYPSEVENISHWYNICLMQFSEYIKYRRYRESMGIGYNPVSLLREQVFSIPYVLSSKRTVILRGKWDGVDLKEGHKIYLREIKTKGDVNSRQLARELTFDLQTMIYLIAIQEGGVNYSSDLIGRQLSGIRYCVTRRPLAGGKYSITKYKPTKSRPSGESNREFYERLREIISKDPEHFFMAWTIDVTGEDIARFRRECLNPVLEQLCDWWDWIQYCYSKGEDFFDPAMLGTHWRSPYGVYDPLKEGGITDYDNLMDTGSELGMERVTNLFPELADN